MQQERESTFSRRPDDGVDRLASEEVRRLGLPVQAVECEELPPDKWIGQSGKRLPWAKATRDTCFPAPYPGCSGLPKDEKVP
jgi:hypothetical protein